MSNIPSSMKLASILGTSAVIFLLDAFYVLYAASHGLEVKTQPLMLGSMNVSLPIEWFPLLGVVILSLVAWYEAYVRIFPRRGIEVDPLGRMRLLRAIAFSIAFFIFALYIPAIVGSNWFWARLGEIGKSVSQVRDFGPSLLNNVQPIMGLYPVWQYSLTQTLASALMMLGAWTFARAVKRPRKPR